MFLLYANPILIAAAIIPAVILLIKVYQADKYEKEPPHLLLSLITYGILSTGIALILEQLGSMLLNTFCADNPLLYQILLYFVVVAFSEEGAKYVLLKKRTWNSSAFNYRFDGVVYAVFVSLGFALWENISYVLQYGLQVAMIRAVTAVPGHACFGVFMGLWYGSAKLYEGYGREGRSKFCRTMAVLVPALLHGAYDFIASSQDERSEWGFVIFIAVMFFAAYAQIKRQSSHDQHIPGTMY